MKKNRAKGRTPDDARMPFTSHLAELRSCLIKSFLVVAVAFGVCYAYVEAIFFFLTEPLLRLRAPGLLLIGTGVPEAFFMKLKIALIASLFAASPVILWQAWKFIAPGLYEHEKRYARQFVLFGTLFFLLGAWFCYAVVFEAGYGFLIRRYQAISVRPEIRIGEYLSFSADLMLAFGVIFELPVLIYFLTRVGLIDHRFLIRQFRYALILIFLLAALLSPPDIISQALLALPLALLYGAGVGVAYFARQK